MLQKLAKIYKDFESLIFPNICINCKTILVGQEEVLCLKCKFDLPKTKNHLEKSNVQLNKFTYEPRVEFVYNYLWFRRGNVTQKLVSHLKYKNMPHIGVKLGEWYGIMLRDRKIEADYLIPVPLNKKKEDLRGYNQSERFALGLSQRLGIPLNTHSVIRAVNTQSQTKKSKIERWLNVETVFKVTDPEGFYNKRVILVDDVLTTGATFAGIIDPLVKCGVKSIGIITIGVGRK